MSNTPIWVWFGLTRANYLVVPRLALQNMPVEWQEQFVKLLEEFESSGMETPDYHVLRTGEQYTSVANYDPDDETSSPYTYTVMGADEWANYRHGKIVNGKPE